MSLVKVRGENMHSGYPQTLWVCEAGQSQALYIMLLGKTKLSFVMLGKVELCKCKHTSVFHHIPSVDDQALDLFIYLIIDLKYLFWETP